MHRRDVAGKSGGTETRGEKRREEREKKVGGDLEWRNAMGKEALRDYKVCLRRQVMLCKYLDA